MTASELGGYSRSLVDPNTATLRSFPREDRDLFIAASNGWIVGYDNVQFTKAANVLRGMGLSHLNKNESARKELADKGMAPD